MKSSTGFEGQRGHAGAALVVLVTLGLFLVSLAAATPAAANGVKRVTCALPYVSGGPNLFCTGTHKILYTAEGFTNNNATITAELEARDVQGNVRRTIPVHSGDLARITSRTDPSLINVTQKNNLFIITAPIPVLHVTADDGESKAEAFCSPVPYLQVIEPDGAVSSLSEGDVTKVTVAITLVDASQLVILVDGVDIFAQLGVSDPRTCTSAAPCGGGPTAGMPFTVADLVVDSKGLAGYASNTVTMSVSGLGCGGHLFSFNSQKRPNSQPNFVIAQCYHEPIAGTGLSSGFGVTVDAPTDGQAGLSFPVNVQGTVCSGPPDPETGTPSIATLNINGKSVSTAAQICTTGNGTTTAGSCNLDFNVPLDQTDLAADVNSGTVYQTTYDLGSNRVVATASDLFGNRAFSTPVIFGTGTTQNPGFDLAALSSATERGLQSGLKGRLQDAVKQRLIERAREAAKDTLAATTDIPNAFLIGLSPAAIQQQFEQRCKDPVNGIAVKFAEKAVAGILATPDKHDSAGTPCVTCGFSIDYTIHVTGASVPNPIDNINCTATLNDGFIHINMDLPNVIVDTHTGGECGAIPVDGYEIDFDIRTTISGIKLSFDIFEGQIVNQTTPDPNATAFISGTQTSVKTGGDGLTDYGICAFFDLLVTVLTFGLVDLAPSIDIHNSSEFAKQLGNSKPDPIGVCDMNVEQDAVSNYNGTLEGKLTSVEITPGGLRAGLKGSFGATNVNPLRITPGAVVTQPALPVLPVANQADAFITLSTDALNVLLASLALGDVLTTTCQDSGLLLGDLLPANCDSLTNESGLTATAAQQGVCHAVRQNACESLVAPAGAPADQVELLTAVKQGACHGFLGHNCSSIPTSTKLVPKLVEKATCNATPNLNMNAGQGIVVCTQQDIPPRLLPTGGGGSQPVTATMRLRSLSAGLVLDRAGTGAGDLGMPKCFSKDTGRTENCSLFEACLDINYIFDMTLQTCTDGKPGIVPKKKDVQTFVREAGVVCDGGGLAGTDSEILKQSAATDAVKAQIPQKAEQAAPPLCTKGLDLSGLVNCTNPKLLVIETDGDPAFKDWLGVTCTAGPPLVNQEPRDCTAPAAALQLNGRRLAK